MMGRESCAGRLPSACLQSSFDHHQRPLIDAVVAYMENDSPFAADSCYVPLLDAERLEQYGPGGLHPVHLGDKLQNGRYLIIRKLGHGAFSTVWLARDSSCEHLVAIKIIRSQSARADQELRMHEILLESKMRNLAQDCIVTLLDKFEHIGPNGRHLCLTFPPLGPDITTLFRSSSGARPRLPYELSRQAVKQLLTGLYCLHECRIACGDINFGNLLLTLDQSDLANEEEEELKHPMSKTSVAPSKQQQSHNPKYICEDFPLGEFVEDSTTVKVKLSDLGAAFPFHDPPKQPIVPLALRAPEVILDLEFDHPIDVWSFGCIAFELLIGTPLFAVASSPVMTDDETNDDHLLKMAGTLGPLPPALFSRWPRGQRYFNSKMEITRTDVSDDPVPQAEVYIAPTLETMFMTGKSKEMTMVEARSAIRFLQRALQYEPSARPTISQLMEDPWIKEIEALF